MRLTLQNNTFSVTTFFDEDKEVRLISNAKNPVKTAMQFALKRMKVDSGVVYPAKTGALIVDGYGVQPFKGGLSEANKAVLAQLAA